MAAIIAASVLLPDILSAQPHTLPFEAQGSLDDQARTSTERLFRGRLASECAHPKACPSLVGGGPYAFAEYQLINGGDETRCIQVTISPDCADSSPIHVSAWSIPYQAARACAGYLADLGPSPAHGTSSSFSFDVPPRVTFYVLVNSAVRSRPCEGYVISVASGDNGVGPTHSPTAIPLTSSPTPSTMVPLTATTTPSATQTVTPTGPTPSVTSTATTTPSASPAPHQPTASPTRTVTPERTVTEPEAPPAGEPPLGVPGQALTSSVLFAVALCLLGVWVINTRKP